MSDYSRAVAVCNETKLTVTAQKFVAQLAMIPNLKIDYVVLNAGVLRYPNVSPNGHACRIQEPH